MPLFKSWRNKASLKSLKSSNALVSNDNDNADAQSDFGPRPTNYGAKRSGKSLDRLRSHQGKNDHGQVGGKASAPPAKAVAAPQNPVIANSSVSRPGRNGSPPITPKSPARQTSKQSISSVQGSNDGTQTKLASVVATGPAASTPPVPEKTSAQDAQPSASGMARSTSRTSQPGTEKPRPSELFAGKGVQWDSVKLAGPGSAPAEQNRPAPGTSNNEDLQQFLKMRRQWKPQFAGTDDLDDESHNFQPPKDLSKLSFGSPESQMPSRGLMSLDDLEKSHTRKQQLLDDQPLGEGLLAPVAESSNARGSKPAASASSAVPIPSSTAQPPPTAPSAAMASSSSKSGRQGLASAFSFTRKSSASSVKRTESSGSAKKAKQNAAPPVPVQALEPAAAPMQQSLSKDSAVNVQQKANGDTGHAALSTAALAGAATGVGAGLGAIRSSNNGIDSAHPQQQAQTDATSAGGEQNTAKPDLASGNVEAPRASLAVADDGPGLREPVAASAKPDLASGNLEASAITAQPDAAAAPGESQLGTADPAAPLSTDAQQVPAQAPLQSVADPLDPLQVSHDSVPGGNASIATVPGGAEAVMAAPEQTTAAPIAQ